MTPVAFHIGGTVIAYGHAMTLLNAERLRDEVAADFMSAARFAPADAFGFRRSTDEMIRLSAFENDLRRAIEACREWRKAAGWKDPHGADGIRMEGR